MNKNIINGQVIALTCGNCECDMELNHLGHTTAKSIYHYHCANDCGAMTTVHWFSLTVRDEMINALVVSDIESIRDSLAIDDESFLDAVLKGDGWIPYNQLSDKELQREYQERILDGDEE